MFQIIQGADAVDVRLTIIITPVGQVEPVGEDLEVAGTEVIALSTAGQL